MTERTAGFDRNGLKNEMVFCLFFLEWAMVDSPYPAAGYTLPCRPCCLLLGLVADVPVRQAGAGGCRLALIGPPWARSALEGCMMFKAWNKGPVWFGRVRQAARVFDPTTAQLLMSVLSVACSFLVLAWLAVVKLSPDSWMWSWVMAAGLLNLCCLVTGALAVMTGGQLNYLLENTVAILMGLSLAGIILFSILAVCCICGRPRR